jgi:hypothetical protein
MAFLYYGTRRVIIGFEWNKRYLKDKDALKLYMATLKN